MLPGASSALHTIFPEGVYALDVRRDPDLGDEQLVLSIGVKRNPAAPHDGGNRLLAFQEAWGYDADLSADGRLTVVLSSL